jgi:hypothetical protein
MLLLFFSAYGLLLAWRFTVAGIPVFASFPAVAGIPAVASLLMLTSPWLLVLFKFPLSLLLLLLPMLLLIFVHTLVRHPCCC